MAKDLSNTQWHGIARKEIPWHPTVDADACVGCELCFVTCGREVYEITVPDGKHRKAEVARPYNCMVGCSTCSVVCPVEAIHFPSRDVVWEAERKHKIFKTVHAEAAAKRGGEAPPPAPTRRRLRVAGLFGDKELLLRLRRLIAGRPLDVVDVHLHVPTVQGLDDRGAAYMDFTLTTTDGAESAPYVDEVAALVAQLGLQFVDRDAPPATAP